MSPSFHMKKYESPDLKAIRSSLGVKKSYMERHPGEAYVEPVRLVFPCHLGPNGESTNLGSYNVALMFQRRNVILMS